MGLFGTAGGRGSVETPGEPTLGARGGPAARRRCRGRIAERAYGEGWRTSGPPAGAHVSVTDDGRPRCAHYDRVVEPATDCGPDCPAFEPGEAPALDAAALRAARSRWVAEPAGVTGRQAGLDRFR